MNRIDQWRVTDHETLSDHKYIMMRVNVARQRVLSRAQGEDDEEPAKRWALKKLDTDRLMAAVASATWPGTEMPMDVDG